MSQTDDGPHDTDAQTTDFRSAREIRDELSEPEAGEFGTPVDARCTECKSIRAKRAPVDPDRRQSFQHVCHRCRVSTWWNVIRVHDEIEEGSA